MNIKVKAGLEVAGFVVAIVAMVASVRLLLTYLVETYGPAAMLNGAAFCFISVAAYVAVSLLYDIRVNQLKSKEILEKMTKK